MWDKVHLLVVGRMGEAYRGGSDLILSVCVELHGGGMAFNMHSACGYFEFMYCIVQKAN